MLLHASPRARGVRKYECSRSYIERNSYLQQIYNIIYLHRKEF